MALDLVETALDIDSDFILAISNKIQYYEILENLKKHLFI